MITPTKIEPDRIKDSFVQVFYESNIPFIPMVGFLYSYLDDLGFIYLSPDGPPPINDVSRRQFEEVQISFNHLFVNDEKKVKLTLNANKSITFNCQKEYLGWSKYESLIHEVLDHLLKNSIMEGYGRVGIRYISEFPNIDILTKLKFDYTLGLNAEIDSGRFQLTWSDKGCDHILNIANNLKFTESNDVNIQRLSAIDIDVINHHSRCSNIEEIMKTIDDVHLNQKETFFSLLTEAFIKELNPTYS